MKKTIIILLTLLFITSCALGPQGRTYVNPVVLHPPKPDAADIRDITWRIWNLETMENIVAEADAELSDDMYNFLTRIQESPQDSSFSWWVLDAQQYQNFILDVSEIKRYIEQQNLIIQYYRDQFPAPTENTEVK